MLSFSTFVFFPSKSGTLGNNQNTSIRYLSHSKPTWLQSLEQFQIIRQDVLYFNLHATHTHTKKTFNGRYQKLHDRSISLQKQPSKMKDPLFSHLLRFIERTSVFLQSKCLCQPTSFGYGSRLLIST